MKKFSVMGLVRVRWLPVFLISLLVLALSVGTSWAAGRLLLREAIGAREQIGEKAERHFKAKRFRDVRWGDGLEKADAIAAGDALTLNLFDDVRFEARVDRVTRNKMGTRTLRARIPGKRFANAVVVTSGDQTSAFIDVPERGKFYQVLKDRATGAYRVFDIDREDLEYRLPLVKRIPQSAAAESEASPAAADQTALHGTMVNAEQTVIDVMVVYTPAARQYAANRGGIDNIVAAAMANAQLVADNSDVGVNFRLVHSAEVNYTESGSNTDLQRLTNRADGYMDEMHAWRDAHGADMVALLTNATDVGGVGWLLTERRGNARYAFCLVSVRQAATSYTLVHEMGHNLGMHHHREQTFQPGPGIFSYSAGWRWTGSDNRRYNSVMSYESGAYYTDRVTSRPVPYFSNPDVRHLGAATGHAQYADNARTLRETKDVVAAYRQSTVAVGEWRVTPAEEVLAARDYPNGAVVPARVVYNLANTGGTEVRWSAAADADWVTLTPRSGVLSPGASISITAAFNSAAAGLTPGRYGCEITFSEAETGLVQKRAIALSVTMPLGRALNNSALAWTSGDDAPWFGQAAVTHDGEAAAQSGAIANGQVSWLRAVAPDSGTLSFWWRTASNSGRHHLEFHRNNALVERLSGTTQWQFVTAPVEAGQQLQWRYVKEAVAYTDENAAGWVDQVALQAAPLPPPVVEGMEDYDAQNPVTWPVLDATQTARFQAADPSRSYNWTVRNWQGQTVTEQTNGAAVFEVDPAVLLGSAGAGVYTLTLTDRTAPGAGQREIHIRVPMQFVAGKFAGSDTPDRGTYYDDHGSDTFTVLGGPQGRVYRFEVLDQQDRPVTEANCGVLADALSTHENDFFFTQGIAGQIAFRVRVRLDRSADNPDVQRLVDAGLDEVWSDVFTLIPRPDTGGCGGYWFRWPYSRYTSNR
ncbi:reprolysin-like metallopeptidase [Desulfatitalea alkaliphila]|uniref:M12 family metallo-peptidase n=1 Tax=Desulfatitalea alkaliphila TaxID=2929485 RepID=A0AA41UKR9_9BACT|nr:M12 family metallo-peptidase [Desulfatitalea alkaliphila]MCJ8501717.1 M12 family metallo-peptidase [Desulfatitalea alkaliphila]